MKFIKSKIILYLCLVLSISISAQTAPPTYWVHGLGGDVTKWNAYAPFFEAAHPSSMVAGLNSLRPTYASENGLILGADEAVGIMNPLKPEGIAIGHSMGGLVAREIARMPSRPGSPAPSGRFAGLVTIASPHSGAFIGNSLDNGSVNKLVDWGATRLTAGPLASLGMAGGPIGWPIVTALGGGIAALTADHALGKLKDNVATLAGAPKIKVGHADMVQLNNATPPNMPKVALQAVEQEPILWRVVSHVTNDPANTAVNAYNDDAWPNNVDLLESFYYTNTAVFAVMGAITVWFAPPLGAMFFATSAAWLWGATWFNHANDEWHWVIGASGTSYVTYSTGRKISICDDIVNPRQRAKCEEECLSQNNYEDCFIDEAPIVYAQTRHDPSDGVVPLPAQEALPGKLGWTKTAGLPPFGDNLTGCGHQEARNHAGITTALTDVFNGVPHPIFFRPQ
jgi:pimeloyl-ACP methyl ester carboxylesterase